MCLLSLSDFFSSLCTLITVIMAEGVTFSVGEEKGKDDDFLSQMGVGRGYFKYPFEISTPGPKERPLSEPVITSTRYVERSMPRHDQNTDIGELITQIAEKLGQSILAQLQPDKSTYSVHSPEQPSEVTLSNVKLVMHSDAREPPIFRGDVSDKFTVHEWETLMTMYLKRRAIPVHEHSQEILAKLMGKAGDVVKIKLRNTSVDHTQNPTVIFDILKQHFSVHTYSNMPLADFYNTLPKPGEDAMEYWIRLNKTMDVAGECLKRQGRSIEDPNHEVSMMFTKHCPDQSLANVFKFKSAEKWLASEIQERLDEHMQDKKSRASVKSLQSDTVKCKAHSQCQVPLADSGSDPKTYTPLEQPSLSSAVSAGNDYMKSLVGLLDRLVMQQSQIPVSVSNQSVGHLAFRKPCRVCSKLDHSTVSHCRRENRCLKCLSPGHWKKDCTQRFSQQHAPSGGSAEGQNQKLN